MKGVLDRRYVSGKRYERRRPFIVLDGGDEMSNAEESVCKSVFRTGDEPTKEAFTKAMARLIARLEGGIANDPIPKDEEPEKTKDT